MPSRALQLILVVASGAIGLVCAARARSWTDSAASEPLPAAASKPAETPTRLGPRAWQELERQRLPAPPIDSLAERRCPALAQNLDRHSRVLQLTVSDARVEPKQLLPLALTSRLSTRPLLVPLEDHLLGNDAPDGARELLERLNRVRFRGVYRITDYAEPRLVRKIDKIRPEWLPGVLAASFVVQDLETGQGLCQTAPLIVRSDTQGAPISSRQRAATRERLLLELGQKLRRDTLTALRRITNELELPGSG